MDPLYNGIRYNSKIRYNVNPICKKSKERVCFHLQSHVILLENIRFAYFKNRLGTNTQDVWFIKELFKNIRYSCLRRVHIKFLYNSKLDFTAKSLVTNTVVGSSVNVHFFRHCTKRNNAWNFLFSFPGRWNKSGKVSTIQGKNPHRKANRFIGVFHCEWKQKCNKKNITYSP